MLLLRGIAGMLYLFQGMFVWMAEGEMLRTAAPLHSPRQQPVA